MACLRTKWLSLSLLFIIATRNEQSYTESFTAAIKSLAVRQRLTSVTNNDVLCINVDSKMWCICINCKFVTRCDSYHFVEQQHGQPHMIDRPDFTPVNGSPTIHVNIRTERDHTTADAMARLWSEHEAETIKAENVATASAAIKSVTDGNRKQEEIIGDANTDSNDEQPSLIGENVYDVSPVTLYEYDVVKCASFVEDQGAWIRNMPEEIRVANPDFVPS